MILGLGPVLRSELITTARRGRYYVARTIYGSALLLMLWQQFGDWEFRNPTGSTPEELHRFAESTFIAFARTQFVAVLSLLPALVAGVIADEHQRKTLHYLLASRLNSLEIVLGKLGARLLHVGTFVALGLPVVALLALYGGLDPVKVACVYGGTFTTVLFVGGISIFVSILARRPRDAILAAYALEALWLIGAPAIRDTARHLDEGSLWWVWPLTSLLLLLNPVFVLDWMTEPWGYRPGFSYLNDWLPAFRPSHVGFAGMVAIQTVVGALFLVLAIAGLRPIRGSSWPGGEPRKGWWARLQARAEAASRRRAAAAVVRNELLAGRIRRPSCGDAPMIWKERHTTLGGGLRWLGGRPMMLFCGVLLGCFLFDLAYPAMAGIWRGHRADARIPEINRALREATAALSTLGLLAIAAASAVAITAEREQDTWTNLATTLLTPEEVIVAKQIGALWSARRVGLAMLILWAFGGLMGAIHPLGILMAAAAAAIAAWFAATVGVFASSSARNSTRALAGTFIALLILLGAAPFLIGGVLYSADELAALWTKAPRWSPFRPGLTLEGLTTASLCLAAAAVASLGLTMLSIRRLDATWGRA